MIGRRVGARQGVVVDADDRLAARRPMFVDAADWLTRTVLLAVPDQDSGSLLRLPAAGCCGRVVFRTRLWTFGDVAASPDGTQVTVTLETGVDDVSYIGVLSLRTKRMRQITFGRRAHHAAPSWSPDGRSIAFVELPDGEARAGTLAVIAAGGGTPVRLGATGSRPAWGR